MVEFAARSHRLRAGLIRLGPYWALGFAGLHLYWAAGGRLGLPAAADVSGRSWLLVYDLIAGGLFLAAAVIGRLLLGSQLSRPRPQILRLLTLAGVVLALARAWVGLAQDATVILLLHQLPPAILYDLWFLVAGLIFLPVVRAAPAGASAVEPASGWPAQATAAVGRRSGRPVRNWAASANAQPAISSAETIGTPNAACAPCWSAIPPTRAAPLP